VWTGIEVLRFLRDLRESMPDFFTSFMRFVSDALFQFIVPILLISFLIWFTRRDKAELLMFTFGVSMLTGYVVKDVVKQPRPWIIDPDLRPDPQSIAVSKGSLPSGHTTSAL
jgi:membrane-associated phospholipid phosphatase